MPLVSEEHREKQRAAILKAAVACFSRRGVHRTSIQDICREAKRSAGAIYTYFKCKDEIIHALAQRGRATSAQMLANHSSGDTRGAAGVIELLKQLERRPDVTLGFRLDVKIWAEALDQPRLMKLFAQVREETLALLEKTLAEGEGEHRSRTSEAKTRRATAVLLLMFVQGLEVQKAMAPTMDVSTSLELLQQALTKEGSARRVS
jgi:AcrR family transcriptional regulator